MQAAPGSWSQRERSLRSPEAKPRHLALMRTRLRVLTRVRTSKCRCMTQSKHARWRHKVDRGRAATKVVVAVMEEGKETRLVRAIRLGTRVKVRINPGRGNRWWCNLKVVARRATVMTMETRLLREPGTRRMTLEWKIDWGLAHWTRMTSA